MNIKNYTSGVPVERSVMMIEKTIVEAGALHISKAYLSDGRLEGIMFQILVNREPMIFKLPADVKRVEVSMLQRIKKKHRGTEARIKQQAERTAWKLLVDWVSVQTTMIRLQQVEPLQVFLAYAFDVNKQQTFFDRLKEANFKLLTSGKDSAK